MGVEDLAAKVGRASRSVEVLGDLYRPLLMLLAAGEPVAMEALADTTGRSLQEVRRSFASLPDTELDAQGRIVGYGLTLRPTPHHFTVDARLLYTWCALDTLVFPAVLGRPATVSSPCRATGAPVRIEVDPERVTSVEPAAAVVSLVTPDRPESARSTFCHQVHFFVSAQAAGSWLEENTGASIHPVAEAHQLGKPLVEALLTGKPGPAACC